MDDSQPPADSLLDLFHRMEPLKHLRRSGWVDREVAFPETVAAHSWRLALMAWVVAEVTGIDAQRAVQLALVHDLAEVITGDLTPFDGLGLDAAQRRELARKPDAHEAVPPQARQKKAQTERDALASLLAACPPEVAHLLREAWEEYEERRTPEAQLVKQLDILEAYLQGQEYAADGRLQDLQSLTSFRDQNHRLLQMPLLLAVLAALERWAPARPEDDSAR